MRRYLVEGLGTFETAEEAARALRQPWDFILLTNALNKTLIGDTVIDERTDNVIHILGDRVLRHVS